VSFSYRSDESLIESARQSYHDVTGLQQNEDLQARDLHHPVCTPTQKQSRNRNSMRTQRRSIGDEVGLIATVVDARVGIDDED
jgi:hypothetical protein